MRKTNYSLKRTRPHSSCLFKDPNPGFVCSSQFYRFAQGLLRPQSRSKKSLIVPLVVSLFLSVNFCLVCAYGQDTKTTVSSAQLDTFMKKWSEYKPFQVPMDPKDEPLLQAALKKDPKGPWAHYFSMKFAETRYKARNLSSVDRTALYGASLTYLKPARDILALSVKADPDNFVLQHSLNQLGEHVALASLEAGLDFAAVKSFAEAALAKNKDTQSFGYGNTIFNENTLLGRVALREGKLDEAKKHLLAAGHTPGSPQLNSFGPDFILARELAEKGEYDTVIAFLDLVARFWANPDGRTRPNSKRVASDNLKQLESWKKQLRAGKVPDHRQWR